MTGDLRRGVHAELYVRSLAPRGATDEQAAVLETLEALSDRDTLADYQVHVCGEQLPATHADAGTAFGQYLLNRIAVFSEWAERNGCSLGKLYERRSIDSAFTGTTHDVIRLPTMALAEYEGTDLRFVAPCTIDGETISVRDRIDELLAGREMRRMLFPGARAEPPETTLRMTDTTDMPDMPPSR